MKKTFNKSEILKRAWDIFKNQDVKTMPMFGACWKLSWDIAKGLAVDPRKAEKPSFKEIHKKYYKEVLNYIKFKMGNGHYEVVEEICNDTFLKAEKFLPTYDKDIAKISTWLKRIARNMIIDNYRKETKIFTIDGADENGYAKTERVRMSVKNNISDYVNADGDEYFQVSADSNTSASVESKEVLSDIAKAFRTLNVKHRKIAVKYFLRQKSYDEVAELCQIPLGSVKGTLSRLRVTLQNELQRYREDYALD